MTDPSEAPGSNYERPSHVSQGSPSEDRGLGDMLSREIPRRLPIGLAALIEGLTLAIRSRETVAQTAAANAHDRGCPDD
jgi:hypothetical protein